MKIAVSDLPFAGFKVKQLLSLPVEYGVEFFYEFGKNYYWDNILPQIEENRKVPCSMHGPCVSVNLANPEDSEFFGIFRKAIAYSKRCRAEFIVVHTNEEWTGQRLAVQELVFERLKMLVALAADYKVRILIENVGLRTTGTLLFDWEDYQKLLKKLPRARALLDTGHANVNNWDISECVATLNSRLFALHLHDNDGKSDQHLAIGEGNIAWGKVFGTVKKSAPQARLILEYANTTMPKLLSSIEMIEKKYLI
jgi:sugar phosphate isomerase/epimerase